MKYEKFLNRYSMMSNKKKECGCGCGAKAHIGIIWSILEHFEIEV